MHMRIHWLKYFALGCGLASLCSCSFWRPVPERPQSVLNTTELETYLSALVESGKPPGISLVVVKNGTTVYAKGFGWADEPRNMPMTPQSVCHWWSNTKIVTAIAILQLQEQGKLQLEDSVRTYLPYFDVHYPSDTSRPVTIQHLLTHSSGLPDAGWHIIGWIHHDYESSVNQTALVKKVLPDFSTLEFEPGAETRYSNIGYMVLGAIIEKVSGQTYEDYVREYILKPLAMNHTDFLYTKEMELYEAAGSHPFFNAMTPLLPFVAGSYIRQISNGQIWMERVYNDQTPPTGLIGSATDAGRLVAAYQNGGELDGQRILDSSSISTMTHDGYVSPKDGRSSNRWQGIGWQVHIDSGRTVLRHSGGGPGFSTEIRLFPERRLGFILFANDATCEPWNIVRLAERLEW